LRTKEQETRLILYEHDDDDDENDGFKEDEMILQADLENPYRPGIVSS
jgi:hypothetical protein